MFRNVTLATKVIHFSAILRCTAMTRIYHLDRVNTSVLQGSAAMAREPDMALLVTASGTQI